MLQTENQKFWEAQAENKSGHNVSWWDINMKKIEIATISKCINPDDYVLDLGCSNGSATAEIQEKTNAKFLGIDYSQKAIEQTSSINNPNIEFKYQDIRTLNMQNTFDKVMSMRCLINIMDEDERFEVIKSIHSCLKPNGTYIMCEAFVEGFKNLNKAREFFGLNELPMPKYNSYINEKELEEKTKDLFYIDKVIKHSSLYYLGTRVFQYMCNDSDPTGADTPLHRFFADYSQETSKSGDFGPNKVYLLRKK